MKKTILTTILSLTINVPVPVQAQTAAYDFSYWEPTYFFSEENKLEKTTFKIKEETAPIFKQKGEQLGLIECGLIEAGMSDTERTQQRNFWIQIMYTQNPELETNNAEDQAVFSNAYTEKINSCF